MGAPACWTASPFSVHACAVTLIDDQVGQILDVIERRGELDNTVIVVCADHGEFNGDWGICSKKSLLSPAVRIPLIVRTPQSAAARRLDAGGEPVLCSSPAELIDVGATLADAAGTELKHRQFGRSLLPVANGSASSHREDSLSEYEGEVMLQNEEWKAVANQEGDVYLLFDRVNDPLEQVNLAGSSAAAAVEQQLKMRMMERLVQSQVYMRRDGSFDGIQSGRPDRIEPRNAKDALGKSPGGSAKL